MKKEAESSIGTRIKSVRDDLGLSQGDMAAACGVSREMWGRYERGVAVPSAEVLARAAMHGADAVFVLTGMRSAPYVVDAFRRAAEATRAADVPEADRMDLWVSLVTGMQQHGDQERQRRLLDAWGGCSDTDQDVVLRMAEGLAASKKGA
jgi:transcriptional regulator with XRE-family HTH domain